MIKNQVTSIHASLNNVNWRFWAPRLLAGVIGLILLTAGLLKATDIGLFIRQIKSYGIITNSVFVAVGAWAIIVLECTLGTALLISYRPRVALPITIGLMLIFMGANIWAWFKGGVEDCGCFGAWVKRTPAEGVFEGIILLTAAFIAWINLRHVRINQARFRAWIVTSACVIGLGLPMAFGISISQFRDPQSNTIEAELLRVTLKRLDKIELNHGSYLIVLLDTECVHCQESVIDLNILTDDPDLPKVIALCPNDENQRKKFVEEFQPAFPIFRIKESIFWNLLGVGDVPRIILYRNQHIQKIWDQTTPHEDVIRKSILSEG